MKRRAVVAIDGPAGAGKSTVAKRVADRLNFIYIDTGAMYRAVALWAQREGKSWEDLLAMEQLARAADIGLESNPARVTLNGEDVTHEIRRPEIAQGASKVSAIAGVRRALVDKQRQLAERTSVVMEGRDIGTVVFPRADVKIFLDAEPEVRADRRVKDLGEKSPPPPPRERVLADLNERDHRDRTRAEAPLMQAPDAVLVDSTGLAIEEVEERILKIIRDKITNGKELSVGRG
jgi:cytidylate kinase